MRVAGIDADTKTVAIVVLDGGEVESVEHLKAKGARAEARFHPLCELVDDLVRHSFFAGIGFTFIELPIVGVNPKATRDQAMLVGAIRMSLLDHSHSMIDNTVWKKAVLGNGKATKEEIKDYIMAAYPSLGDGHAQDVYDAAGIAHFGVKGL